MAAVHGTPLYIYEREKITGALTAVQNAFPGFNVIYSVKANPFEPVLDRLRASGAGIDAASKNEALTCARLGFPRSEIYYSAPGKKATDISACLGCARVIADSFHELGLIDRLARERGMVADVGIRLNIPRLEMQESRFEVMSGEASKFGVTLAELLERVSEVKRLESVRINGIHAYFGSQLTDAELVAANFNAVSRAALEVADAFPGLEYINYGGGFGVPYEPGEQPLDLGKAAELVLSDPALRKTAGGMRRNIELGRYLTARAGVYVAAVADVKVSGGIKFVILDGGMNAFFRPKFTGQTHRVSVPGKTGEEETVRLAGNTCTPLDVFYGEVSLPPTEPGDLVVFENAGAYGYSMSMLDFISFDRPAQVMW
ncbi:MAG: hypothetical protein LBR83_04070 [Clostridiales bacterium]|nr:hypothetical protein [Clostridiales bacterium]